LSAKVFGSPYIFFSLNPQCDYCCDNNNEPRGARIPASENPPWTAAILYISLKNNLRAKVTLDVLDAKGNRIGIFEQGHAFEVALLAMPGLLVCSRGRFDPTSGFTKLVLRGLLHRRIL